MCGFAGELVKSGAGPANAADESSTEPRIPSVVFMDSESSIGRASATAARRAERARTRSANALDTARAVISAGAA
jgi:hypothetical protein